MNGMSTERQLRTDIMRRVRVIYLLRYFASPLMLEAGLLVVFTTIVCLSVSVPNIIANVKQIDYMGESLFYIYSATLHTKHIVQIMLMASAISGVFIVREFYRSELVGRLTSKILFRSKVLS